MSDDCHTPRTKLRAFTHGVYLGLTSGPPFRPPDPTAEAAQRHLHYYRGGYVAGTLLQAALLVTVFLISKII